MVSTEPSSTAQIFTAQISTAPITAETPSARIVDFQQVTEPLELSLQSPINSEIPPPLGTPSEDLPLKARVASKQVIVGRIGLQSFPVQAAEQKSPAAVTEQTDVIERDNAVQSPQPKPSEPKTLEPQPLEPQPQDKRHEKPQPEIRPLEPSPWPTQRTLEQTRPLVWTLLDVQTLMLESSRTHQQNLALFAHPGIPEAVLKNMSEPIQAYLHSRQALDLATALWQCLHAVTAREGLTEHFKPDEISQADAVKTPEEFTQLEHERDDILVERNQLQRELTLLNRQKFKLEAELANVRASTVWYDKQKVNAASSGSTSASALSPTKTVPLKPVAESKSSPSISSPPLSSSSTSTFTPSKSNRVAPPLYTVAEQRELQRRTNLLVATLARCEYYRLRISDVSTVTGDPGPWRVVLEHAIASKLIERWSDFVQMTMTERTRRKLP